MRIRKSSEGKVQSTMQDSRRNTSKSTNLDLKELYPMSNMWPLRMNAHLFFISIGLFALALIIDHFWVVNIQDSVEQKTITFVIAIIVLLPFATLIGRLIIYYIEKSFYDYKTSNGNFHISRGIFLKQRGSFPLSRITDIYLDRSILDWFFRLYNVHISTPTSESGTFARIPGLSEKNAMSMQQHIEKLVQESSIFFDETGMPLPVSNNTIETWERSKKHNHSMVNASQQSMPPQGSSPPQGMQTSSQLKKRRSNN